MDIASTPWLVDLFRSIDRMDADAFSAFLDDQATFRFGNAQPVIGREAVKAVVGQFFASIQALSHDVAQVWDHGDTLVCHGTVTYTRRDGSRLSVPFANVFSLKGDRITRYLIFADTSALYVPARS